MNRCQWCGEPARSKWCGRKHRQAAWRLRQRSSAMARTDAPLRMAYADPPYPGFAWRLYRQPEVDHESLVKRLVQYDGWALSTSAKALGDVLALCPADVRVCAWVKPIGAAPATYGLHNTWEPLIVSPGRRLRPGTRDWLSAQPARLNGTLIGRKPLAFCAWLFECLGMVPGDSLDDLFPGTGIVGRSWSVVGRSADDDASLVDQTTRRSAPSRQEESPMAMSDGLVAEDVGDGSLPAAGDAPVAPRARDEKVARGSRDGNVGADPHDG